MKAVAFRENLPVEREDCLMDVELARPDARGHEVEVGHHAFDLGHHARAQALGMAQREQLGIEAGRAGAAQGHAAASRAQWGRAAPLAETCSGRMAIA